MLAFRDTLESSGVLDFWGSDASNPLDIPSLDATQRHAIAQHQSAINAAKETYTPLVHILCILNILSLGHASAHGLPQVHVFYLNSNQHLYGDHLNVQDTPPIICCLRGTCEAERYLEHITSAGDLEFLGKSRPYWQEVTAIGNEKGAFDTESWMLHHLNTVLRYRPDLPTAYGIHLLKTGFIIFKLDAFILEHRGESTWDCTEELQRFMAALYCVSKRRNPNLCFVPQGRGLWRLKVKEKQFYVYPFYASPIHTRGTWIAAGYPCDGGSTRTSQSPLIFKVYWANRRQSQTEGELSDLAHRDSQIPGLARVLLWSNSGIQFTHRSEGNYGVVEIKTIEQHCVVLESWGRPLSQCGTVLDILKAAFDLLEVHQHLAERGILHRNINFNNVFYKPSHIGDSPKHPPGPEITTGRPFIQALLEQSPAYPLVTLTGLDNAFNMSLRRVDDIAERIGTPGFIAREIAMAREHYAFVYPSYYPPPRCLYQEICRHMQPFSQTPPEPAKASLQEASKAVMQLYTKEVEEDEAFDRALLLQEEWLRSDRSTEKPEEPDPGYQFPRDEKPQHQPMHDAESVFWELWFLLARANPTSPVREANDRETNTYKKFCAAILSQRLDLEGAEDSRNIILLITRNAFYDTLHPSLSYLGAMLSLMSRYFHSSALAWKRESLYHSHIMMKGLILTEILRLYGTDGIPLDTSRPRSVFTMPVQQQQPVSVLSSSIYEASVQSGSSVYDSTDTEPDSTLEDKGPSRKRRKLGEPTQVCRTFRISPELPMEFDELRRSKERDVEEDLKSWMKMCHEAADTLSKENAVDDQWLFL